VPAAAEDVTGEVRSALTPSKPQRTASMRDRAISQPVTKRSLGTSAEDQHRDYDRLATARPTSESPVREAFLQISLSKAGSRRHTRKIDIQHVECESITIVVGLQHENINMNNIHTLQPVFFNSLYISECS